MYPNVALIMNIYIFNLIWFIFMGPIAVIQFTMLIEPIRPTKVFNVRCWVRYEIPFCKKGDILNNTVLIIGSIDHFFLCSKHTNFRFSCTYTWLDLTCCISFLGIKRRGSIACVNVTVIMYWFLIHDNIC